MTNTIIENCNIVDGLGNASYQGKVFIADNKIVNNKSFEREAADVIIDATGLTLMPGLIDVHCHSTFDEPSSNDELFFHRREGLAAIVASQNVRKLLQAGVTGFVDPDGIFDVTIDLRDAIDSKVIQGPRMLCGGNALLTSVGGTAGRLIPDKGLRGYAKIVSTPEEIKTEVRRQIKNGVDWIKVHVTGLVPRQKGKGEIQAWSLKELKLVCDTAHELGVPVMGHCRNSQSIKDSVEAGMDMLLHATFMDEKALEKVVERNIPLVPSFTFQANLADFGHRVGANEDLKEIFRKEIEESASMLKKAKTAGVPILCGSETGFSLTPYGEWHYRELEIFVSELGFSNLDAIAAATGMCGIHAGFSGDTGIIADGKFADIILVDGDPSQDVTILKDKSNIKMVFVGGERVDLTPNPERNSIPGWRVSQYSTKTLTQETSCD